MAKLFFLVASPDKPASEPFLNLAAALKLLRFMSVLSSNRKLGDQSSMQNAPPTECLIVRPGFWAKLKSLTFSWYDPKLCTNLIVECRKKRLISIEMLNFDLRSLATRN